MSAPKLRGHAYFVEFAGRNGPGWGPWLAALAVGAMLVAGFVAEALR